MKRYARSLLVAFGLLCTTAVAAPPPKSGLPTLSPKTRSAALEAIKTEFRERYVFPEMRPKIIERLDREQQAGRYDVDDSFLFAERITEDLRDVAHDHHLSLQVNPAAYAAALAAPESDAGEDAFMRKQAIRDHHGLVEMKRLSGNLRYLKISGFEWVNDETGAVYDDAMRFLKDGDAIIIDLRNNGGGSHAAVRYLVSHFMDGDTLEMTFLEGSKPPVQSRTLEYLPAGRLKGKPLYVLINGFTGSAAEAFAYDVQQFKLGELIGVKTAGAANNNKLLPVAPGFILSVSYGRPEHPVSHGNWEGAGVAPDVETPSAQAFDVAQVRALDRLSADTKATPEARTEYAWAKTGVEARLHPVALAPSVLMALAGRYGAPGTGPAPIEIAYRDDALWLVRPNRPAARLSPLTQDGLFSIEGNDIMRARLNGKTLELYWHDDPAPRVYPREQ
ncbi:S41 family peptidase [Luteimonas panaciterrae]|uniref:S41 family peptidase n=1 Tax=Luteimonas panaciterrae TaxID=363885 RepID=UPI001CFB84A2|nr:S41 family peptidase [Luteimonas panaciterrae]